MHYKKQNAIISNKQTNTPPSESILFLLNFPKLQRKTQS